MEMLLALLYLSTPIVALAVTSLMYRLMYKWKRGVHIPFTTQVMALLPKQRLDDFVRAEVWVDTTNGLFMTVNPILLVLTTGLSTAFLITGWQPAVAAIISVLIILFYSALAYVFTHPPLIVKMAFCTSSVGQLSLMVLNMERCVQLAELTNAPELNDVRYSHEQLKSKLFRAKSIYYEVSGTDFDTEEDTTNVI